METIFTVQRDNELAQMLELVKKKPILIYFKKPKSLKKKGVTKNRNVF